MLGVKKSLNPNYKFIDNKSSKTIYKNYAQEKIGNESKIYKNARTNTQSKRNSQSHFQNY